MHRSSRRYALRFAPIACAAIAAALLGQGCGGETTRESVWNPDSIPDAFSQPSAALVWPGLSRSFLIDSTGSLLNGLWRARFDLASDQVTAPGPGHIASEERWRPVFRWNRRAGDVEWRFEAVAFPARSDQDSVLAVSLVARVVNLGAAEHRVRMVARLDSMPRPPLFIAPDGDTPPPSVLRWVSAQVPDSACGWCENGVPGGSCATEWPLAPHAERVVRFVLPSHPLPVTDLVRTARVTHAHRAGEVRAFWEREIARGTRFELGDPEVENALRAASVVLLECRERWAGAWYPIGGPFHYRDTWLRDGARLIQALATLDYGGESRQLASGIAALQWPQGAYLTQRGQLDGTGQALWAFEQAALRPSPDSSVASLAVHAMNACQWSEWQRSLGRGSGWPYGRMLPFANPHDAELSQAQLVGNDLWMLAGYRAAARLCGAAGRSADSAQIEAWRDAYAGDFADALARRGVPDVPPCWQRPGRDWGNLTAAWPSGVLHPLDPRCERLARRVWASAGGAGLTCYGGRDSFQTYVGADLGVWAMLADHRAEADSVLSATLAWRNGSGAGAEIFSRSTHNYGVNLPPHPTSAAALVALVRNAVIFDDGDTLELTLGARDRWWRNARIQRAPTRWGRLELSFSRTPDRARWAWSPVPVWTRLRVPPGTRIAAAPTPPLRATSSPHFVLAPPGISSAEVSLVSESGAPPR